MKFPLFLIIFFSMGLTFVGGAFAESGKEAISNIKIESSNTESTIKDSGSIMTETPEESEAKKQKIKDEISSYIIDSYKVQGDKIIKDIELTLQKTVPAKADRIGAYKKIQSSLEARKMRNKESQTISDMSRDIIDAYLTHMIDSLGKRIQEVGE